VFRLDRVGRKGGGVSTQVRDGIHAAVLQTAKHEFGLAKKHEPRTYMVEFYYQELYRKYFIVVTYVVLQGQSVILMIDNIVT
jgi:hypothetical protein